MHYLTALNREIELAGREYGKAAEGQKITSVFVGGGTPSLLGVEQVKTLFDTLKSNFAISENAEITIEANPESLTKEKLEAYIDAGINRISIGVQSLDDENLRAIGRIHSSKTALYALNLAKEHFENISCDIIVGLPFDTVESVQNEIRILSELVNHISVYQLILENGTPLADMVKKGQIVLPNDDETRDLFDDAYCVLKQFGFCRYEVSNFAKGNAYSRHNLGYWTRNEYLGFGAGAASFLKSKGNGVALENETRFTSFSDIEKYIQSVENADDYFSVERAELEKLQDDDIFDERIMLGLRTVFGVEEELISPDILKKYSEFFVKDKNTVHLNDEGMAIMNTILVDIMRFDDRA